MRLQQWGTFSVRDHVRPRAFVADILLYDKLVIPRPATEREMRADGATGPVKDQMDLWRCNNWEPDRQRQLLDILGEFDLAIELPWAGKAQAHYRQMASDPNPELWQCGRSQLALSVQNQIKQASSTQYPYIITEGLLSLYVAQQMDNEVAKKLFDRARTPGVPVESVMAYGSYDEFDRDLQADEELNRDPDAKDDPMAAAPVPYAMFGWEFFVPEDSSKTDAELLRAAATLASDPEYCDARQYFYGWLNKIYEGEVDRQDAYDTMRKMYSEYEKIMRKSRWVTVARYAAKVAQVLAPLAALAGNIPGAIGGVGGASLGLATSDWIPMPKVPLRLRSAAILYDARKFIKNH